MGENEITAIVEWNVNVELREVFQKAANDLVAKTREEFGCIYYDLYESLYEPNKFIFVETWSTERALEQHTMTSHYHQKIPVMQLAAREEPKVTIYVKRKRMA